MANQLISIADAADLTNKSSQTIRRMLKAGKVKYRRKKTPQGFNYMIDKASLMETCGMMSQPQPEQPKKAPEQPTQPVMAQYQEPPRQQQPIQEQPSQDQSTYTVETPPEIYILESEDYIPPSAPSSSRDDILEPAYTPTQKKPQPEPVMTSQNYTSSDNRILEQILEQQRIDKEKLYQVLEVYQKRVSVLEEQVKQLEGPKKRWWVFWR